MAEFLIELEVNLPPEMPQAQKEQLRQAERARGQELRGSGALVRIWRIPGRSANVALWKAEDATALHALLESLPLFPWANIVVRALAEHPLEA